MKQLERMLTITRVLTDEGLGYVAARLSDKRSAKSTGARAGEDAPPPDLVATAPTRVRHVLERLGPMFVKFGQILSTREDLLPKEYCVAFASLHSRVPPFASEKAREIIEAEHGKSIDELFASFEDEPLAAASLAQVHAATLKDGSKVVVKVQRPEATTQVHDDTELLLFVSRQLDRFLPPYKAARIHSMAQEFARASVTELDFRNEAKTAARFKKNFENRQEIYVPAVHAELTTGKVLVMERVFGHKLDSFETATQVEAAGIAVDDLVKKLFRAIMTQAYVHGLIHADLHPGNVFVLPSGQLAMIDFGLYGELGRSMQNALFRSVLYRTHYKHVELADAVLELMEPTEDADRAGFRARMIEASKKLEGAGIAEYSIARSIQDEGRIANECGFVAPNELMMLSRALVTAEGIAIKFMPDVQIAELLRPIMKDITLERFDLEKIAKDGLLVLPDLLEMIELAPAFHRNLLKVERAFAKSASLSEFVTGQLRGAGDDSKKRERRRIGPFLLAIALWALGAGLVMTQPNAVATLGDLSIFSGAVLLAAVVTMTLALTRR